MKHLLYFSKPTSFQYPLYYSFFYISLYSFSYYRDTGAISLCHTNIIKDVECKEYIHYFSETSFQQTLRQLILSGEYNKTKKRSTPMYCYGSTITFTRFPKFFAEGKPQILPRPYFSSKPGQWGYELVRTTWMHSLFKEVESHVLHYLHNICEDRILKK